MKITYKFLEGQAIKVDVEAEYGDVVVELNRKEYNNNRKETRRRYLTKKDKDTGKPIDLEDVVMDKSVNVEADAFKRLDNEKLSKAIKQLLPQQRELIHKVFIKGLSLKEIAAEKGVTYQALQNQLNKIYKKLKKLLI